MILVRLVLALTISWGLHCVAHSETYTPGQKVDKDFESFARSFLHTHCVDCHGESGPEGGLSLDGLGAVDEINSATWVSVWAQVSLNEMPPKDMEQPGVVERLQFSDWLVGELACVLRDKGGFRAHLDPDKGNFVDYELLFGPLPEGIELAPTSSPARLRRLTPEEHITRLNELIAHIMKGDIRGLPTNIVYSTKTVRPLMPVYDLMKDEGVTEDRLPAAVDFLFKSLVIRPPSKQRSDAYLAVVEQSIEKLGEQHGAVLGLSSILFDREARFRPELAGSGKPDRYGRVMLQDWELGLAVNHALRYIKPDEALRQAIVEGRMRTREDVKRMLADGSIRKPRILRFCREYFDCDRAGYICKDSKALAETGVVSRGQNYYFAMFDATASTDRLVELILQDVAKKGADTFFRNDPYHTEQ